MSFDVERYNPGMAAVNLFDVLVQTEAALPDAGGRREGTLTTFAERMVAALRDDYRRLKAYEEDFDFTDLDDERELLILRSIWRAFDHWAQETEGVVARVEKLGPAGKDIEGLEELRDQYCVTRARLTITPDSLIEAKHQDARGEVFTAQELRDELRARLHGRGEGIVASTGRDNARGCD